jgi:spore germination cell wall hydrolase CwlJ-like protein
VPSRNKCQFSWYCDGKADQPLESNAWEEAYLLSIHVINMYDVISDPTEGSIMYHAVNVKPYWTDAYKHKVTIGDHIFYGSL